MKKKNKQQITKEESDTRDFFAFYAGADQQREFFTRPRLLLMYIFRRKAWEAMLMENQARVLMKEVQGPGVLVNSERLTTGDAIQIPNPEDDED